MYIKKKMLNLCKNVWRKDIQSKYVKIDYIELYEYAINVGLNTLGSVAGEKLGNKFGDKMQNLSFGATKLGNTNKLFSKASKLFPKASSNGIVNQIYNWRSDNE